MFLNEATGSDYGECRYRKTYKAWKAGYDYAVGHTNEETIQNELQRLKIEKVKLQDERTGQIEFTEMLPVLKPLKN